MQTEFEAKILEINIEDIVKKLDKLWAKRIWEKLQKRLVYDFNPKKENSWIRLRDNGTKTTLTIKEINNDQIDGTEELEVEVEDFERTNLILEKLGYISKLYQENKRISYTLDDIEIEIDTRPLIPPYLEIEAKSLIDIEETIKKLGFDVSQTTSMNTIKVYKKYWIELETIKELKFEELN